MAIRMRAKQTGNAARVFAGVIHIVYRQQANESKLAEQAASFDESKAQADATAAQAAFATLARPPAAKAAPAGKMVCFKDVINVTRHDEAGLIATTTMR